ncbi:MAG: TRAP transporter substrate-binding protein, partial [Myxococcota bacterium]|nr:TRAP transporter substrate-binding protein [Myxococcota bacterium]
QLWEGLSSSERQWLEASAQTSSEVQRKLWNQASANALRAVEEAGVTVVRPDPRPFVAASEGLRAAARDDPVLGPIVFRIEAQEH